MSDLTSSLGLTLSRGMLRLSSSGQIAVEDSSQIFELKTLARC